MKLSRDVLSKSVISYAEVKVEAPEAPLPIPVTPIDNPIPYVQIWNSAVTPIDNTSPMNPAYVDFSYSRNMVYSPVLNKYYCIGSGSNSALICSSTDGKTWVIQKNLMDITEYVRIHNIGYSPELNTFCAIAVERDYSAPRGILYSNDGENWIFTPNEDLSNGDFLDICWNPQLKVFCAVGNRTNGRVLLSSNGKDWAYYLLPYDWEANPWGPDGPEWDFNSVCWGAELSLFCACSTDTMAISKDGKMWSLHTVSLNNPDKPLVWRKVVYSPLLKKFCAITESQGYSATSTDGINWTVFTNNGLEESEPYDAYVPSMVWSPKLGLFIASYNKYLNPGDTRYVYTSTDGETWTKTTCTFTPSLLSDEFFTIYVLHWNEYNNTLIGLGFINTMCTNPVTE